MREYFRDFALELGARAGPRPRPHGRVAGRGGGPAERAIRARLSRTTLPRLSCGGCLSRVDASNSVIPLTAAACGQRRDTDRPSTARHGHEDSLSSSRCCSASSACLPAPTSCRGAQHARLPSQTHVVANGGRAEQFLIRLPADRIDGDGRRDGRPARRGDRGREHAAGAAHGRAAARRALQGSRRGRQRDRRRGAALERQTAHDSGTAWSVVDPEPRRAAPERAGRAARRRSTRRCAAPATTPAQRWSGDVTCRVRRPRAATTRRGSGQRRVLRPRRPLQRRRGRSPASTRTASCSGTIEIDTVTRHGT